jgi:hypothetical protein
MTTGPDGRVLTPAARRADIAARYGALSYQTLAFDQTTAEIRRGATIAARWTRPRPKDSVE